MRRDVDLAPGDAPVSHPALASLLLLLLALPMAALSQERPCAASAAGSVVERSFEHRIALDAGCDYLVEAEQANADVVLSVLDPGQRAIIRVDAPTGRIGPERAMFRTQQRGTYTLRMEPRAPQGSWGRIEWRLSPLSRQPPKARSALILETQASSQYAAATEASREQAQVLYREALEAWRSSGSARDVARAQLALGWLEYTWMGNWDEAARLGDDARGSAGNADSPLRASATLLGAMARLESAQTAPPAQRVAGLTAVIEALDDARLGFERLQMKYEAVFAQNNAGLARQYLGDSAGAVRVFQECVAQFAALRESARVAMARQNVGWVQIESGEYVDARDTLTAALEDMRGVDDGELRVAVLNNYANVTSVLGDYEEAIRIYLEAHDVAVQVGNASEQGRALQGLGVTYVRAGNDERAERYFRQAFSMRSRDRREMATLLALGNLLRERGDLATAIGLHDEARGLASIPLDVARVQAALGNDRAAQGDWPGALRAFEEAADEKIAGTEIAGIVQLARARALVALNRMEDALSSATRAIDVHTQNSSPVYAADAYALRAQLHRRLGHAAPASRDIDAAIALSERGRARLSNPDLRTTYLATRSGILEEKLQQLAGDSPLSQQVAIDSLLVVERWRAAGLRDRLDAGTPSVSEQRRRLQDALIGASYQLQQAREKRRPDPAQILAIDARTAAMETALDALESRSAATPGELERRYSRAALQRLQSQLGAQYLVTYFTGDAASWRWVITQAAVSAERLPGRASLRRLMSAALPCYSQPIPPSGQQCSQAIQQLSSVLVPRDALPADEGAVIFVPDGLLSAVPFAALRSRGDERYLVQKYDVAVAPAVSLLGKPARTRSKARTLGIVADPVYAADDARLPRVAARAAAPDSLPRLPAAAQEAAAIARAWPEPAIVLQGVDARRERVLNDFADRVDVLHFATHVTVDQRNPDLSRIELSRYDAQQRLPSSAVGPRDFRSLRLNADLVVLSGCQSGLGRESGGEGMIGLHQSLMSAGARNVIATLWTIPDQSAGDLMARMYQRVGAGEGSYRRALRDAQLSLVRSHDRSAPYYWAAFQLYSTCLRC